MEHQIKKFKLASLGEVGRTADGHFPTLPKGDARTATAHNCWYFILQQGLGHVFRMQRSF